MDEPQVAVVIPTHEPGRATADLIARVIETGHRPIVVDDGSSERPRLGPGVEYLPLGRNRGIAAALNVGAARARSIGASHLITLDQDSMIGPDYVQQISKAWMESVHLGLRPAVVAPGLVPGITYRGDQVGSLSKVHEVMQSGAMFHLEHLREIGGFDESLVIDCVDTDACLRLREAGWDVVVAPVAVEHQLGRVHAFTLGPRTILLTRHAPFRDYYMARNRVLMIRAHGRRELRWALGMARRTLVAFVLTALLDQKRWTKVTAMRRGLWDGLRGRRGPLPPELRQRWNGSESGASSPAAAPESGPPIVQ